MDKDIMEEIIGGELTKFIEEHQGIVVVHMELEEMVNVHLSIDVTDIELHPDYLSIDNADITLDIIFSQCTQFTKRKHSISFVVKNLMIEIAASEMK